MDDKRYTPPGSDLRDQPPPPGSPWKAVLIGYLVDMGGTFIASALLAIVYAAVLAQQGMSQEQIRAALTDPTPGSSFYVVGTLAGCGFSFLGGYWCARIARRSPFRLGGILATLSTLSGMALSWGVYPPEQIALLSVTSVACVLLGSKFGADHVRPQPAA
jgi:glycerol uptake facilitator-like aquaporin